MLAGLALAACTMSASRASAEQQITDMQWLLIGPVFGWTTHPGPDGGVTVGAEASLFLGANEANFWSGGYLDAVHDPGRDEVRCTFGPEFGYGLLGVDGGVLLVSSDDVGAGLTARAFATLGLAGVYARVGWSFLGVEQTHAEFGAFLKLPLRLSD